MESQAVSAQIIAAAPPAWRRLATPFDRRVALLLLVLIPTDILLARRVQLTGLSQYTDLWPSLLMLLACLGYCCWRPLPRLIDTCKLAIWAILLVDALALLIQIAGRSPYPLADRQLNAVDTRLHFHTATIVHAFARFPLAGAILAHAYDLTSLFILAAILLPPICGRPLLTRRYITGVVLAAIVTAILFAFVPAAGPWVTQPLQPTARQAEITAYLARLKSPGPVQLESDHAGIVSFPSFHTVLAVLSAAALASLRWLRIPAWTLAALICIATITTGWHYLIDVLAGLVLSAAALWLAARLEPDRPPAHATP
jgi:membrane-associated phospholipid phosphatase